MTRPHAFCGMPLSRNESLRRDAEAIARLREHPGSRVLVVWRDHHLITDSAAPAATWHQGDEGRDLLANAEHWVLLGEGDGIAHFAVDISHLDEPLFADRGKFLDLRTMTALLSTDDGAVMAYARGLLHWHRRHRFCGACGSLSESVSGGHVRRCTSSDCAIDQFPRTDPAIIVLVSHGDLCLLGRQRVWPKGMYSTLAGFVETGESLEEAVAREVYEESGVTIEAPTYHSSQPWPFPGSIMLGFHARAQDTTLNVDTDELETASWFRRNQLLASPENSEFRLPRRGSIARRLIEEWLSDDWLSYR